MTPLSSSNPDHLTCGVRVLTVFPSRPLPAVLASRPSGPAVAWVAKRRLIRRSRFPPVIQTLPQLLQQAREVHFVPLLHDLAVHDPVNVNPGSAQLLPRRRDTGELTFVLDAVGVVGHHLSPSAMRNSFVRCKSKAAR